jgi:hypothetical protein
LRQRSTTLASAGGTAGATTCSGRAGWLCTASLMLAHAEVAERSLAGEQLVEHEADRIHVAADIRRIAAPHLRRAKVRRADELAARDRAVVEQRRKPEVDELHLAGVRDHHVARLDVAVQDAAPVRRRETAHELDADPLHALRRHRPRELVERLAANELPHEVRPPVELTDAVQRRDVRMLDARGRACLREELAQPLGVGRGDELHRDVPLEQRVARDVHEAALAARDRPDELVLVERRGRGPGHLRIVPRFAAKTRASPPRLG